MKNINFNRFVSAGTAESMTSHLGMEIPNPFEVSIKDTADYWVRRTKKLFELAGEVNLGCAEPQYEYFMPQYDGRLVIAAEYGVRKFHWDGESGSFWCDKGSLWSSIATVEDVDRIPMPKWDNNPLIRESISALRKFEDIVGKEYAQNCPVLWTDGSITLPDHEEAYIFASVPSFIDLGGFLMGESEFLTLLAGDEEVAQKMMEKCALIALSYADYMAEIYQRPIRGWGSLGGDNSCLLSADMYRQYAMNFDDIIRNKVGNIPRNLHSCGASSHLYKLWGEYKERDKIVCMQTRAIPGVDMAILRSALPDTFIQLTMYLPQIDMTKEIKSTLETCLEEWSSGLGNKNFSIMAMTPKITTQAKENILLTHQIMNDLGLK